MKRVIIESPFAGDEPANIAYARAAVHDSLMRSEAPFASHLIYTQPGILDGAIEDERACGIEANLNWLDCADLVAVYTDRGVTPGMHLAINAAKHAGKTVEERSLPAWTGHTLTQSPSQATDKEHAHA